MNRDLRVRGTRPSDTDESHAQLHLPDAVSVLAFRGTLSRAHRPEPRYVRKPPAVGGLTRFRRSRNQPGAFPFDEDSMGTRPKPSEDAARRLSSPPAGDPPWPARAEEAAASERGARAGRGSAGKP